MEPQRNITQSRRGGRIKRQAARFSIYVYDEQSPEGLLSLWRPG